MASEAVKVIVRCRPLNQKEREGSSKVVVTMVNSVSQVSIVNPHDSSAPPKTFTFDGAYYMDSTTEQIYNDIAYPLVEGIMEGYNGTVFAYGQTGCGKSFCMQGPPEGGAQRGIIPRAFEHIFEAIATSEDTKFLVRASYLEIYNEEIRDLLARDCKKKLELKEHPEKGAWIPALTPVAVHDVRECEKIMERGWRNRSVGSTLMNADSSRSHSIFTVSLEMVNSRTDGEERVREAKLNLVDLAGSERQTKTGATGDRLKEATKINLSLSALGNVISALVDGKCKHIPYRDSKLTRLLQDSLGGNTKTLMVACLSPADSNYEESLTTLRYANRAKNIQNKPKINEDPKDALVRQYQEEIKRLKDMLTAGHLTPLTVSAVTEPEVRPDVDAVGGGRTVVEANNNNVNLEEEKQRLKMEYEQMMQELREKYNEEQRSNVKLQEDVERLRQHYKNEMERLNNQGKVTVKGEDDVDVTSKIVAQPGDPTIKSDEAPKHPEKNQEEKGSSPNKQSLNLDEALKRLQELEEQMVGGEKAHDKELKEKRLRKKRAAEKRLRILADALHQVDEDDKAMLKVYDNIQEELKAKTDLLKQEKQRVRALDREIKDLQSEFEFDRTDYLETIRRQDQQMRLVSQLLDKIQPCLRRDCNYSNLDRVKGECVWDEDQQRWRLPELVVIKTKLPPAGVQPGARQPLHPAQMANGPPSSTSPSENDESGEDKFLQKLERGEREDIAGNYFRPRRAKELLMKAQEEAQRLNQRNNNNNGYIYSATLGRDGPVLSSSFSGSYFISTPGSPLSNGTSNGNVVSGGGSFSGPSSPEISVRKPLRLESLPYVGDITKKAKRKKTGFATVNT